MWLPRRSTLSVKLSQLVPDASSRRVERMTRPSRSRETVADDARELESAALISKVSPLSTTEGTVNSDRYTSFRPSAKLTGYGHTATPWDRSMGSTRSTEPRFSLASEMSRIRLSRPSLSSPRAP